MKIKTGYINPPIPDRTYDWIAFDDETYGGEESDVVGYGKTEIAAIRDLLDNIEANMSEAQYT